MEYWFKRQMEKIEQFIKDLQQNPLCEIKFSVDPYVISKSYAEKLRHKLSTFRMETGTTKTLFLTFITTFGLRENKHFIGLVQNSLTMDALFD